LYKFDTVSTSKPKNLIASLAGADTPNVEIPFTLEANWYHISGAAISNAKRFVHDAGNTDSLYSGVCCLNVSIQGIDTTLTFVPSSASFA
jgi:hypothetical protein